MRPLQDGLLIFTPEYVTPVNLCAMYMADLPVTYILFQAAIGVEPVHILYHWWYTLSGTGNRNGARNGTTNRDQENLLSTVPVLYPVLSPGTCSVNKPWLVPKPTELTGLSLQIFKKEASKQHECIPIGCVSITAVDGTRCHYRGLGRPPLVQPPPVRTLPCRETPSPCEQKVWPTLLKTLPSLAVGNKR